MCSHSHFHFPFRSTPTFTRFSVLLTHSHSIFVSIWIFCGFRLREPSNCSAIETILIMIFRILFYRTYFMYVYGQGIKLRKKMKKILWHCKCEREQFFMNTKHTQVHKHTRTHIYTDTSMKFQARRKTKTIGASKFFEQKNEKWKKLKRKNHMQNRKAF